MFLTDWDILLMGMGFQDILLMGMGFRNKLRCENGIWPPSGPSRNKCCVLHAYRQYKLKYKQVGVLPIYEIRGANVRFEALHPGVASGIPRHRG